MHSVRKLLGALAAYRHSDDPLTAATNLIALCVVGNQPFYPLYVWWAVGDDGRVSFLTFLSTPFFLAIPAIGRRSPFAARATLPIVGVANTLLGAKAFGVSSGVELFLCPCAMIAGMSLRASERKTMLATVGFALAAFALGRKGLGAPLHEFSGEEYAHFLSLNAWSVAGLTAFATLQFSGAYAEIAKRDQAASRRSSDFSAE